MNKLIIPSYCMVMKTLKIFLRLSGCLQLASFNNCCFTLPNYKHEIDILKLKQQRALLRSYVFQHSYMYSVIHKSKNIGNIQYQQSMEMLRISYTCIMKYSTCWRKQSLSFKCVWHKHYFIFTTLKHGTCIQNYIMKIFLISHSILHPLFFEIKIMLLLSNSSD